MFTMIDTIGASAGHAAARAPAIHRVRCVRFSRGPSRTHSRASRPTPCRRRRVTCAAQPPHEDFTPRAARSIHQPASLAAAAAADAQELMSVAGGVLDGGEARRMRFDVASKNLSNDVHGAVRALSLLILPPVSRDVIASTPSSSDDPSPQTHTRRTASDAR